MTIDRFLDVFFGDANRLRPTGERPEFIPRSLWMGDPFSAEGHPIALPRLRPDSTLVWYVLAFDDKSYSALRPQLLAFIGPSYSDFDGTPPGLLDDPVDEAVAAYTEGRYYAITAGPTDDERRAILRALTALWVLREESPSDESALVRPVGRILKEFDWALRNGDSDTSYELLEELRRSGELGALNLAYLHIQRLAALRRWTELLDHPDLDFVMQTRRPRRVTEAVSDAIYHVWFQSFDRSDDPLAAWDFFRQRVADRYAPLFHNATGLTSATSLAAFALWAVTDPQRPALVHQVLDQLNEDDAVGPFVRSIADLLLVDGLSPADGVLDEARSAAEDGAFSRSIELLRSTSDGLAHVRLALWGGYELRDVNSASFALDSLDRLSEADRVLLERSRNVRDQIDSLRSTVSGPTSWLSWFEMLNGSSVLNDAAERARRGIEEWDPEGLVIDGEEIVRLMLEERSAEGQVVLQNSLPSILLAAASADATGAHPRVRELLEAVFYQLALSEQRSRGDLEVLLDLVSATLDSGIAPDAYRTLVDSLLDIWEEEDSARRVGWLLDLGEVIGGYPATDPNTRQRFASALLAAITRYGDSLSQSEQRVAYALTEELGIPSAGIEPRDDTPAADVGGTGQATMPETVGIYTLVPGVGERVRRIVEERYPGTRVILSDDHVASSELRALARNTDVLLIATRAAKHAATTYLERQRPVGLPILYPPGKGSSSMLTELEGFVGV